MPIDIQIAIGHYLLPEQTIWSTILRAISKLARLNLMIFLDSPATTPLDPFVLNAMLPYLRSTGTDGRILGTAERSATGTAARTAREFLADLLNCLPNEIVWTSGATEANNMAILGFAACCDQPGRIVSQATEHSAVLEPLRHLRRIGWDVEILPVDELGRVSLDGVRDATLQDTDLVSIMWGNNEIGTIQPIVEIATLCSERGIALHCDAAQAVGKVAIDLSALPITMLTLSAHKFYGPIGAGALFVRDLSKRNSLSPLMFGGGQEYGLRPGTLNIPAIVGLGAASQLAKANLSNWSSHTEEMRRQFESYLMRELADVSINGDANHRLPHVTNIAFYGTDNEGLLTMLPQIIASTGSACHVADFTPSHVLSALNKSPDITECSLRFGFTKDTTKGEIVQAARMIVDAVSNFLANA